MHVRTHTNAQGDIFRFFLCRQGSRDAVRWKATVTDEKSLASFLSVSLPLSHHLPPLTLSPILFLFALSCVLIIAAALSAADSISSPRFIVLHFFASLSLFGPSIYFFFLPSSLCFTLKEEIGTLSCNPSVVTLMPAPVPCSVLPLFFPPFLLLFHPCNPPTFPTPYPYTHTHTHTSATFTHVQSAGCVTPSALWVWMHAIVCVCVCVCVCVQCELVCRDDIAKLRGQRQFWCIIKLDLWMLCNHTDPQKQRHTHTHAHTHTHTHSPSGSAVCRYVHFWQIDTHANKSHMRTKTHCNCPINHACEENPHRHTHVGAHTASVLILCAHVLTFART